MVASWAAGDLGNGIYNRLRLFASQVLRSEAFQGGAGVSASSRLRPSSEDQGPATQGYIMPVMGGVGALFGADMLASAEGSKPNRVVGDIGGMRHSTGRWPSSRRESRSRSTFWAGASMCSSGLRLPSAGRCGRHRLCVVRQGAGRFCRPGRCLRARCHSSLPPSSSS